MVHPRADADAVTRDPQVICLGEALVDRIVAPLASAGAAAPWVDYPGGAPANVATALGKLGTVAGFLGCLGQDPPGDAVLAALVAAGVNCQWVQRCTAPTRVVLVQRNAQGDRQFVGFSQGHAADFADGALEARALPEPWFEQARYLVMGTLGLATPGLGQSMEQALVWARRYGVMTVVDLNWRSLFWPRPDQARDRILPFIHAVDILKLNQEEADWLFHTQAASQILPTLDRAQLVLVTGGAAGCWYATPTSEGHVPSFAVPCLETTGAGDAFLAGLLHALCQSPEPTLPEGERLVRAIRYANATGALTTTQAGAMAAQPRPEAVDNLLHTGGFLG